MQSTAATATHCPYCALQCGMLVAPRGPSFDIAGDPKFPVNEGGLCVKGWSAAAPLAHPDRLLTPLVRDPSDNWQPAGWDAALETIVAAFDRVRRDYGPDAIGVFGGGSLTNEKAYLLGKFARVALGTANIDYNGRFCMSSAAAGALRSVGADRGLPFPIEDIAGADLILLAGGNPAETMPPIMRHFEAQQRNGGTLVVVDPRKSATARWAALHLPIRPGTDVALANGLLHLLVRDGLIDREYIAARTEGFEAVKATVAGYWPERVESLTGIPQRHLVQTARLLGTAKRPMVLTARGAEQHAAGVNCVSAYLNLALATGAVGRPHAGFGTLTGQGNGQGGREHGQKADQLPGYRSIRNAADRRHVAGVWEIPESDIPAAGRSAYELLESAGQPGGIRALFVMGSNPVVSAPNATFIIERLKALDFLVVCDFFVSETAELADVVLPSAQWIEEDGTMTSLEGRVVRRHKIVDPPGEVRTDVEVLCALAAKLGFERHFAFESAAGVFDELGRATRGATADYSGITYERIEQEHGVFWPCPDTAHGGTRRMFDDGFPTANGRATFHAVEQEALAEDVDAEYPVYVTTGRVLAHYQSGTQTRRTPALAEIAPEPLAEMHPRLARQWGVSDGERIVLATRRGSALFRASLTADIRHDTVFVPFHWPGERSANRLTHDVLDPISRMPSFKVCAGRIEKSDG